MQQRFLVLDSFRGLFAVFVVLYHMNIVNSITTTDFFRGSWLFVEFFFVLSGFVLTHGYINKKHNSFKKFFLARVFRIFPLHIFILLIFLIFELIKFVAYKKGIVFGVVPFTGAGAIDEIIPNLLLIHAWTGLTEAYSFNFPSWSISIEFYMYMIFFVTLLLTRYRIVAWMVITSVMLTLVFTETNLPVDEVKRGMSSFFAGCLTYVVFSKLGVKRLGFYISSGLEVLALMMIIFLVSANGHYSQFTTVLVFCFTILLYSFELGVLSQYFKKAPFVLLGKLSYSVYMVHAVILAAFMYVLVFIHKVTNIALAPMIDGRRAMDFGHEYINNIVVLIIVLVIVLCANFTNKYIERTALIFGKRIIEKQN